jgi:hypothetical protein
MDADLLKIVEKIMWEVEKEATIHIISSAPASQRLTRFTSMKKELTQKIYDVLVREMASQNKKKRDVDKIVDAWYKQ